MNSARKLAELTASELLDAVLTGKIAPNFIDEHYDSPLIAAMHIGSAELVEALLASGADANLKMPDGEYPLQVACRYAIHGENGYHYLDSLLAHGGNLNLQFIPPLHGACLSGDLRLIRYLISHGADPNYEDGDERPPADWAKSSKDPEAVTKTLGSKPPNSQ